MGSVPPTSGAVSPPPSRCDASNGVTESCFEGFRFWSSRLASVPATKVHRPHTLRTMEDVDAKTDDISAGGDLSLGWVQR